MSNNNSGTSRQKSLLQLGRALSLVEDSSGDFATLVNGYRFGRYTVTDVSCTCPEFKGNAVKLLMANAGHPVDPFTTGCKHVVAVQALTGQRDLRAEIAALPFDEQTIAFNGMVDQQQKTAARKVKGSVKPGTVPVAMEKVAKVEALKATRLDGGTFKDENTGKNYKSWHFGLGNKSAKEMTDIIVNHYNGIPLQVEPVPVTPSFEKKLTVLS